MQILPPRLATLTRRLRAHLAATLDAIARSARLQIVVLCCGVTVIASTLFADHRRVESTIDALGERVDVYVVKSEITPGDVISPIDVHRISVPRRFMVATAIHDLTERVATQSLVAGDVLTTSNTTEGASKVVPIGWRGLTIDAGPLAESLTTGMIVDVMAGGTILVEGALVIEVIGDARSALVAVPQESAVAVADAASVGLAVLAIAN